jgi:hypothetical protein
MNEKVYSIIRHALTFAGGALIAKGVIDEAGLEEVVGSLMTIIGFGWSYYNKIKFEGSEPTEEK